MRSPGRLLIAVALFAAGVWLGHLWFEQKRLGEEQVARLHLEEIVSVQAKAIERRLSQSMTATYVLALKLHEENGSLDDFERFADILLDTLPGITNLQLAPDGVIARIHPLAGHEKAIGHNLLRDDRRRKEAMQAVAERRLTVAGPFKLVQDGVAVVGRNPVFLGSGQSERFWGFASALILLEDLL